MTGVVLALCLMAVPAGLQEPADEAATLIGQLGAPAFRDREAAERALETLGEPALPALRRAQQHTDAEVRHRVRRLIKRIAVVSDADLQTLRADLFELLRAEEPPAQVLTLVRRRLERFAAAHRVRVPGAARTFRSSDGRVVCVIGRSARPVAGPPGEPPAGAGQPAPTAHAGAAADASDEKAELVIAIGGAGEPRAGQGQSGGAATAQAPAGLAIALGGTGGDTHPEAVKGGWRLRGTGAGGAASATAPAGGLAFPGAGGALVGMGGRRIAKLGGGTPALPEFDDDDWARLRAFVNDKR